MTNEQFGQMFEEIMYGIESGPGCHIDRLSQIADKYNIKEEMMEIVGDFFNSLGSIRLAMKYLMFDIEATNREKKQLISERDGLIAKLREGEL